MKQRTRKSPDLADATVVLAELFRQRIPDLALAADERRSVRWRDFQRRRSLVSSYV